MKIKLKNILVAIICLFGLGYMNAQEKPEKLLRQSYDYVAEAQEALSDNNFAEAEASYRKAIAKAPDNVDAKYNMGNLYYTKEKSVNAESRLKEAAEVAATKEDKHRIYHNLGNTYMQQKQYQEAVDAFKDALRNDPTDDETRYNLALAKKMLEKEQQNQDQNQDQNSGGESDEEKEDKQQQNQDGEGGEDQNQDQKPGDEGENKQDEQEGNENEKNEKEQGDQQQKDQGETDNQQQQQPRPAQGQLSPQQINNLLEAMNNEEKKVQDKINAEKAKGVKVKSEKDW
ncbi:tetratricopeptide repeat protein [Gramella sp. GC03-9]|uniref:Tetratricopeptide repeat protein n=1 Tax=Christiangramia oceanisediminis TaxID=2920386 RepID=A0A9X2KVW9_9FLAO|nr:tetratricopeptide repeat protein [Gramella oceanisediminis]MCP9199170.1 tetratricopeptide repeat protein [Gramella oceanisediminis]